MFFQIFTVLCLVSYGHCKTPLQIVAFWPLTGEENFDGKTCQAAMNVAINAVNNDPFLLKNYNISVKMVDEGENGLLAVETTVRIFNEALQNRQRKQQLAPIVIAPYFSTGCKLMARTLQHYGIIGIPTSCSTSEITGDRYLYPNLFRIRSPSEMVIYPRIQFIKEYGKWTKIGIMTNSASSRDFSMARLFYKTVQTFNISVPVFETFAEAEEISVTQFKKADVRIVVIDTTNPTFVITFLCEAHNNQMTGEKYFFIAHSNAFINPFNMPEKEIVPNCHRWQLVEQMKYTIWLGMVTEANFNYGITDLGYELVEFEKKIDEITGGARTTEYQMRHICHDAMMHSLIALEHAERELVAFNQTILDYGNENSQVENVLKYVIVRKPYTNLHAGNVRYSDRQEMDREPKTIRMFNQERMELETVFYVTVARDASPFEISNYYFKTITPLEWPTQLGEPPTDYTRVSKSIATKYHIAMLTISSIAILLIVFQVAFAIKNVWMDRTKYKLKVFTNAMFIASVCFDLSTITVLWELYHWQSVSCWVEALLLIMAVSLELSALFIRLELSRRCGKHLQSANSIKPEMAAIHRQLAKLRNKPTQESPQTPQFKRKVTRTRSDNSAVKSINSRTEELKKRGWKIAKRQKAPISKKKAESIVALFVSCTCAIQMTLAVIWLATSPPHQSEVNVQSNYNPATDTLDHQYISLCIFNTSNITFQLLMINFSVLFFLIVFINFMLVNMNTPGFFNMGFTQARISSIIALALTITIIAMCFLFQDINQQVIAICIFALISSVSLSLCTFVVNFTRPISSISFDEGL